MLNRLIMPVGMILFSLPAGCRLGNSSGKQGASPMAEHGSSSVMHTPQTMSSDVSALPPVSRPSCLGLKTYKIVGGQAAAENTQVTAATLKLIIRNQKYCSATLIGDHHIVTAAHCVVDVKNPTDIKIGSGLDGKILDKLQVDTVKVHPLYAGIVANEEGYLNQPLYDVAALHFTGNLPSGLVPVNLAHPGEIQAGMPVIVSGYGSYGSDDKTKRPLSLIETSLSRVESKLMELQLKSGGGRGACYGDSGGPTFIVDTRSSCLLLIGSTTGPGRDTDYSCENGGGTLMDLTRYQSWLGCTFKNLNQALEGLPINSGTTVGCDSF